jgi:thioredoxin 1
MRGHIVGAAALILALAFGATAGAAGDTAGAAGAADPATGPYLPRLVDLGAGKCIPCKKMAPIIEEMTKDYAGIVDVVFVDVWKNPDAGKPYRIRVIPTQVFYDRSGKEVFRHEGFFSREEIEKVFREKMGVAPVDPKAKEKA